MSSKAIIAFLFVCSCYCNRCFSAEMNPKVERLEAVPPTELGEGPHWDAATQSLYFVDIFGKSIHKYVPATNKHTKAVIGVDCVSLIVPVKGEPNKFLVSIGRELAVVTWDGESEKASKIEKLCEVDNDPETKDNRFNDGKCDPAGTLWAGTMGGEPKYGHVKPNKGAFYSFKNNTPAMHFNKVGISNGLAWSADNKKMYYIDTHAGSIDELDYDIVNGKISNRRPLFTLQKHDIPGGADGMTIDQDGNLWIAIFNGYRVIKIDGRKPETLLASIPIPAKQVTSVVFGGQNLEDLYVTTAKFTINDEVLDPPEHGGTYRITGLNVAGLSPSVPAVL
ncbi:unnamed protein product [Phyllotreta striolata]|uniref:Regucalcin n=1 Tax=Phyllotreta striolata TaxID=444603 RepID=A0A9N9TP37_PHYSR|nr:unnamed protein product [Phyllotreta striolata]